MSKKANSNSTHKEGIHTSEAKNSPHIQPSAYKTNMGTKDSFESTELLSRKYFYLGTQSKVMQKPCRSKAGAKRTSQLGSTKESYKDKSNHTVHMEKQGTSDSFQEGEQNGQPQKQKITKVSVGQKGSIKHKISKSTGSIVPTDQEHTVKGNATTYCKSTSASIWHDINQKN